MTRGPRRTYHQPTHIKWEQYTSGECSARAWAARFLASAARWRLVGDKGPAIRDCVARARRAREADEQHVAEMLRHGLRLVRP